MKLIEKPDVAKTGKNAKGSFFRKNHQVKDPVFFQPKLTIGPVNDVYEREGHGFSYCFEGL